MKKNDEIEVECTDLSDQGFGIGHHQGMTVFVSDLLPGEKAKVRIIKTARTYAVGKVTKRENDSPDRIVPPCPKASVCGGCSFMHLNYDAQIKYKEKQLKELFAKVSEDIQVLPALKMENPFHYRNKAQFPVEVKDGKVTGGFYKARTNQIVPIRKCMIQSDRINEVYEWLLDHISPESAAELRHLLIRHSKRTGQMQVVFIGRHNRDLEAVTKKMTEHFPQIASVVFNENRRDDNVILGDEYEILYGSDAIDEKCLDLEIRLHFKSFFQVNPSQMEVLYSRALELADLKKDDRVIELYSGTGTIGMLAARKAGHVTGVEIVPEAVENAKENLKRNRIENAEFICMDASEFARRNQNAADVVLVDPPRKGMSRQGIEDIALLQPERVIYISCNPRTLARDLGVFKENGYEADVIIPVDMFSHTSGIECIARINKKS